MGGLMGGLMVAGGVMTGLGTITGNKKLAKIGAVLSVVGGVGGMISGATTAANTAASVGGEGVSMGTAAGNAGSNAAEFGMAEFGNVADTAGVTVNPVSMSNGIVGTELGAPGSVESFYGAAPPMSDAAQTAAPNMAPGAVETNAAREATQAGAAQTGSGQILGAGNKPVVNTVNTLGEFAGKLKGFGSDALDFIKKKENAEVVKLGSGLVSGAMKSYDQQRQYDQQLADREAQRARFNRSIIGQYTTR